VVVIESGKGFQRSLLKLVSVNFFVLWQRLKKALLGMRQFERNSLGQATG
jgi:hypothetical protein